MKYSNSKRRIETTNVQWEERLWTTQEVDVAKIPLSALCSPSGQSSNRCSTTCEQVHMQKDYENFTKYCKYLLFITNLLTQL